MRGGPSPRKSRNPPAYSSSCAACITGNFHLELCLVTRAFGSSGLRASAKALARTPLPHQTRLLRGLSSLAKACRQAFLLGIGCLFSRAASGLDAFSPYPLRRSCPALPCRTTGKPLAAAPRSSRTRDTFLSGSQHSQQVEPDLSHDGLNPAHVPL